MITKQKLHAAMSELGVVRAVASYSGGNDEGGVDDVHLYRAGDDEPSETLPWEYGEYGDESNADTPQGIIFRALEEPVHDRYGGFAGEFYVRGRVVAEFDGLELTVKMDGSEDMPQSFEQEVW